jgi:hypothetical protein
MIYKRCQNLSSEKLDLRKKKNKQTKRQIKKERKGENNKERY